MSAAVISTLIFASPGASAFSGSRTDLVPESASQPVTGSASRAATGDPSADYWHALAVKRLHLLGKRERRIVALLVRIHKLRGGRSSSRPHVDGCLSELIQRESHWNVHATNPITGAYGLPQALPGSKMASAGADWHDNAQTQIRWMRGYVQKYGGSCGALAFQKAHGWY